MSMPEKVLVTDNDGLARRLRKSREAMGFTRSEAARRVREHPQTWSFPEFDSRGIAGWESSSTRRWSVGYDRIQTFADIYDVTVHYLLYGGSIHPEPRRHEAVLATREKYS